MDRPERLLTPPFVFTIVAELGVFLTIGMLLPVLPVYAKDELGAGSIGIGIAVAAVSPTALLFQPLVGQLGDRRGRRLLVVSGPLVVAGTVASYTLASSLWALVGLRLLGGLGEALLYVGAATIVTDLAPADRRGEAMSLYSLGLWGGLALGPVLGEAVLGDARYDAVWLTAAAFSLAAAFVAMTIPETRPAAGTRPAHRPRLLHPAAIRPGLVLVTTIFGFAGFNTFVALYARQLGLDGAGPVFFLFSGIVVAVRFFGRRLPDRLGAKRAAGSALVLLTVGLLAIGLWNQPIGLYLGTSIFALGAALAFPALMTLAISGADDFDRSSVVGTFSACADVGFALGALTLGGVASLVGYDGVFLFSAGFAAFGMVVLARLPTHVPVRALEAA
ncbi:MAG: MFS transporter [Actinobacteria bacterium]|nr:MAG: MFS transporter [Actinomycetota bacterium]